MSRPVVRTQIVSRRRLLGAGAALFGAHLLPGCDRLVLPEGDAPTSIDPVTSNADFYVTSSAGSPSLDRDDWTLVIEDGGTIATFDAAYLDSVVARETERTLQCIGSGPSNQAIGNAVWEGLPLPELLEKKGVVLRNSLQIVMHGGDGYATSLPRADLDRPMWLVWRMNGEVLPKSHGFPARLLSPGRYGTKNVKWLQKISIVDEPFVGFWESRGWNDDATYRPNTFVRSPPSRSVVGTDSVVLGTAFAGEDPIVRVEVSTDDGQSWEDAEITYGPGPGVWVLWRMDWRAEPGDYVVSARCTTASGAVSSPDPFGTDPRGGYDGSMAVEVTVV